MSPSPSVAMAASACYAYDHFRVRLAPVPPVPTGVALVEIDRPAHLNAFSRPVWLEMGRVFRQLAADARLRAVVLAGAGPRAFTTGLDVQAAASEGPLASGAVAEHGDAARKAWALREHIEELQACVTEVERCAKPVICVLHGFSLGLAIDIACCADIRLCASETRFAVKEVDIGLAADIGTLARLPKIVGSTSWVKDVCLSARDFDAHETLTAGFVSQVFPDKSHALQAALAMAGRWAEKSPVAVQGTKELLNHGREHSTADSLRYTTVWNSVALQAADVTAAMMSGLQKKKPTFEKL